MAASRMIPVDELSLRLIPWIRRDIEEVSTVCSLGITIVNTFPIRISVVFIPWKIHADGVDEISVEFREPLSQC